MPAAARRRPILLARTALALTACLSLLSSSAQADRSLLDPKRLAVSTDLARRLHAHVAYLADPALQGRRPRSEGNRQAAAYIEVRFRDVGLEPLPSLGGYRQLLAGDVGDNVIGWRPAAGGVETAAAPWLLLAAHFDHLGGRYLGADDNASAVAILLETARSLPALAQHHLLFVAFNAEEPPYIRTALMGSQQFVDRLPQEIGGPRRLQAAIVMDLMGGVHWQPLSETIFAAGAEQSPELSRRLKEAAGALNDTRSAMNGGTTSSLSSRHSALSVLPLGLHLIEELPLAGRRAVSDYDAFRNASVPFLFLSSGRTPRYHQPTDLPDTLHYERMASTVAWLRRLLQSLDQDRAPYTFDPARLDVPDEAATLQVLLRHAAKPETEIPGTSALSRWRLHRDEEWLKELDVSAATREDRQRMERVSIRLQCLLADFSGCFFL